MQNHEIRLYIDETIKPQTNSQILKLVQLHLEKPLGGARIKINPASKFVTSKTYFENKFDCAVSESISDGCYGARPGTRSNGWTIWIHPKHMIARYISVDDDGTKTEFVNPWHLFNESGKLSDGLDGEVALQYFEELDLESKSDNTYNFNSNDSDSAQLMFDFQFDLIEKKDGGCIVVTMFHCGGDPRGNYTDKIVFKFKYIDDFYSVIYPSKILLDESES